MKLKHNITLEQRELLRQRLEDVREKIKTARIHYWQNEGCSDEEAEILAENEKDDKLKEILKVYAD